MHFTRKSMSKSILLIIAITAVVIAASLYNDNEEKKRIREIEQNYLIGLGA